MWPWNQKLKPKHVLWGTNQFWGNMQGQEADLSTPCCCCSSEGNRTTGKSYYLLSVCLKKIDQITSLTLCASSFLKQRFGLLLHPLCYLEQRGIRADDSRLQKFLASRYLSFCALRLKYIFTCFSMRSRSSGKRHIYLAKAQLILCSF